LGLCYKLQAQISRTSNKLCPNRNAKPLLGFDKQKIARMVQNMNLVFREPQNQVEKKFQETYAQVVARDKAAVKKWCQELSALGIKAAQPLNGWVKNNKFCPTYCWFNNGICVGDRVAIGKYDDYKIVQITKIENTLFPELFYFYFQEFSANADS
jgi:hypothetical protein